MDFFANCRQWMNSRIFRYSLIADSFFLFLFRSLPLGLTGQRAPLSARRCLPVGPDAAPHRAAAQWVRCSTLPHGSRAGFAACALAQWPLPRPPSVWYSAHLRSPLKGPAAVARPPSCVVAISICRFGHQVVNCRRFLLPVHIHSFLARDPPLYSLSKPDDALGAARPRPI